MFAKLSALALVYPAVVSALSLNTPEKWLYNWPESLTWTTDPGDPIYFNLELNNPTLSVSLTVASDAFSEMGLIDMTFPDSAPPGPGYTLVAYGAYDRSIVYSTTGTFTIIDPFSG